jgi:hypothetical protein
MKESKLQKNVIRMLIIVIFFSIGSIIFFKVTNDAVTKKNIFLATKYVDPHKQQVISDYRKTFTMITNI